MGGRDGAEVTTLADHQCGPSSIPGHCVVCGTSLLLALVLAPKDFSPGTPIFPSPQKLTFPNSNSVLDKLDEEPPRGCAAANTRLVPILSYSHTSAASFHWISITASGYFMRNFFVLGLLILSRN